MGVRWLARRWMRRRWLAMVPLALVVVVGTAVTVVAITTSERTRHAYGDYVERAAVSDVVINPSLPTQEIDEVIRALPGVTDVSTDAMLFVSNDGGEPRPRWQLDEASSTIRRVDPESPPDAPSYIESEAVEDLSALVVRGSTDGRWLDTDRPEVQSGRLAAGPSEAVLSVEAAEASGLRVGDVIPLSFWPSALPAGDPAEAYDEVVEPLGVEHVEIVGTVILPDEVLPDELYPRQRILVSPDLAERYSCLPSTPPSDASFAEAIATLTPADCAATYQYWSVAMEGGAADVKPALDEYLRASGRLNTELADIAGFDDVDSNRPEYFLIPTENELERQRVERAVRPTVAALLVLGSAVAFMTLALVVLVVVREVRHTAPEHRPWHQLGLTRAERALVIALPPWAVVVVGVAIGVGAGWLVDPAPIGLVSVLAPSGAPIAGIAALVAIALGLAATVLIGVVSWRAVASDANRAHRPSSRSLILDRVGGPAVGDGIRAALEARRGIPVMAAGAVLVAGMVAALVFGVGLGHLVTTPRSYGWPWDVAGITGFGYGGLDVDSVDARFAADPDVTSWTVLGLLNEVSINGEPQMAIVGLDRRSTLDVTVLRGSLPHAADEVALGATTAAHLGLDVGDTGTLSGAIDPPSEVTVTAIAVFPTLGPFISERTGAGTGLLLTEDGLASAAAAQNGSADLQDLATFIGIDLAGDDHSPAELAALRAELDDFDLEGGGVVGYDRPVRPPEIIDAGATRGVPAVAGLVIATMGAAGLVSTSWASVQGRRRELAVVRALGFDRRQVRRSVRVQGVVATLGALLVGVPVGVLVGRLLWRSFAESLGVLPDSPGPTGPILVTVTAALFLAVIASVVPGRLATRATPAADLRSE